MARFLRFILYSLVCALILLSIIWVNLPEARLSDLTARESTFIEAFKLIGQFVAIVVAGGAVTAYARKLIEDHRNDQVSAQERRTTRQDLLKRVIVAGHTVRVASLRAAAFKSASGYRDAMLEIMKVRNELVLISHEISALGDNHENELFWCDWKPKVADPDKKSMQDMLERMSDFVEKLIREFSQKYKDELSAMQREATSLWKKADDSVKRHDNAKKARKIEKDIWTKLHGLEHFGSLIREEEDFGESQGAYANVSFFYPYHDLVSAIRWWIYHDQGDGYFTQHESTASNKALST